MNWFNCTLVTAGGILLLRASGSIAGEPVHDHGPGAAKPKVLVILTDQWRGQALSCAGNPNVKTPNIDRLASEGIRYRNAFANCPLCTPSRGSLLTGRYPGALGLVTNDLAIKSGETTLAHILNRRGYRCGYIGKWHLEAWPRHRFIPPGERRLGFDDFWAVLNCSHNYFNAWYFRDTPKPVVIDGYEPEHQTDLAIEFLRDHQSSNDAPFFLERRWQSPQPAVLTLSAPERFS